MHYLSNVEIPYLYSFTEDKDKKLEVLANILLSARKKAVKEFAEKVKMAFYYEFDEIIPSIMADKIDNLVKETVGDTE